MSILDRLQTLVRSNLSDLASRTGDTQVDARKALLSARAQLAQGRRAERELSKQYEDLLDEMQVWEDRALLALKASNETLAREALVKKGAVGERAERQKEILDSHRSTLLDLERTLEAVQYKLEALAETRQAGSDSFAHSARAPTVRAPNPINERVLAEAELGRLGGASGDAFDSAFERFKGRSDEAVELGLSSSGDEDLETRFRELEAARGVERLRKQVGPDRSDLRRRLEEE